MASPTPMDVVRVIVGNVVPSERTRTCFKTTIPNRTCASCVAPRRACVRGGAAAGGVRPQRLPRQFEHFVAWLRWFHGVLRLVVSRLGREKKSEVSERRGERGGLFSSSGSLAQRRLGLVSDGSLEGENSPIGGILFLSLQVSSDALPLVLAPAAALAALQGYILVKEEIIFASTSCR